MATSLKIIPHYESDPIYIEALVKSINKKLDEINWKPDLIIASYHGIPKNILMREILITVIAIKQHDLFQKNLIQ